MRFRGALARSYEKQDEGSRRVPATVGWAAACEKPHAPSSPCVEGGPFRVTRDGAWSLLSGGVAVGKGEQEPYAAKDRSGSQRAQQDDRSKLGGALRRRKIGGDPIR
jgi:hypothetical protein